MENTTALAPLQLFPLRQEDYRIVLLHDVRDLFRTAKFAEQGDRMVCRRCSGSLRVSVVAHPIWDGPFNGAGSGACDYREIPYCFSCDGAREDIVSGAPIRVPWFPGESPNIMKRLWNRISDNYSPLFMQLIGIGAPPR